MNYKGVPLYSKNLWKCENCDIPDTQEHLIRCPSYNNLRIEKDLDNDKDLVEYFRKIILIREKLEDEKKI